MDKKRKLNSKLQSSRIIQKDGKFFTETEKHEIIKELIETGLTKQEIWEKYTGKKKEHGTLLRWMRALGYDANKTMQRPNFVENSKPMAKATDRVNQEYFESIQINKRITELETQLKTAEMKAIAFSTMIDIAEKEFKIPIRKKFITKP